jgi:carboxylesterase
MEAPELHKHDRPATPQKRKRRRRRMVLLFVTAIVCWLAGDLGYSLVVEKRIKVRESEIRRGPDGVQIGGEARTLPGGPIGLLLVHGFNDSPEAFRKMAPVLNEQGFTVRLVRLPGFAEPVWEAGKYRYEDWVNEVIGEVASLRKTCRHVVLAGHSLGGAVAIASVLNSPDPVDGLALLAPAIDVANHRSPVLPTRFWQSIANRLFLFTKYYESPFDRNDARDPAERNPQYKSPFSPRSVTVESFRLMDTIRPKAAEIQIPVLMILTRDDRVVDWVAAETFFQGLPPGFRELVFFDGSGHALTVDYDWRRVAAAVGDFSAKVSRE